MKYAKSLGIAEHQKDFAALMGYSNASAFSQVINGLVSEPLDFSRKMCDIIPNANLNWLLTGEGSMLKSSVPSIVTGANSGIVAQNNSGNVYNGAAVDTPSDEQTDEIPVIPRQLYEAADVDVYEYITANEVQTSPRVEQFPKHDLYYNVYGDEMVPDFRPGDKLAISAYEVGKENKMIDGRVYVIDTKYNGLLLRVLRKAEGGFRAIPRNEYYSEEFIEAEDVVRVFRVLGLIRTNV